MYSAGQIDQVPNDNRASCLIKAHGGRYSKSYGIYTAGIRLAYAYDVDELTNSLQNMSAIGVCALKPQTCSIEKSVRSIQTSFYTLKVGAVDVFGSYQDSEAKSKLADLEQAGFCIGSNSSL